MSSPQPPIDRASIWTTRRLLKWTQEHFSSKGVDAPRVSAEMLLAHTFGCERMHLYMEPDRPASDEERARLRDFVRRVAAHEPVQYVVGEAWFHARPFSVSPATLIPRPSTERLVELAIEHLRRMRRDGGGPARVLDLCTGTGCIAISIATSAARVKSVESSIVATDLEPAAIELASRNAVRHGADGHIRFACGDLYAAVDAMAEPAPRIFDLITANPPYVSDAEWGELEPNVRNYEPALALRGGADGLDLVRRVIEGAPSWLAPGGLLLVEIGHAQRDAALAIARSTPALEGAEVFDDHEGFHRVLSARRTTA